MAAAHNEVTVEFWAKYAGPTSTTTAIHLMDWTNIHGRVELRIGLPTPGLYAKPVLWLAGADNTAQFDKIEKKLSEAEMEQITEKWVHWAFTKSAAGEMAIYRNGQLLHQASGKTKKIFLVNEVLNKVESRAFKGELVELRVWKVARTAEEVAANMRTQLSEPHEDLNLPVAGVVPLIAKARAAACTGPLPRFPRLCYAWLRADRPSGHEQRHELEAVDVHQAFVGQL